MNTLTAKQRRAFRTRRSIRRPVDNGRMRLSVFRSARYIYAQVIDDRTGTTLAPEELLVRLSAADRVLRLQSQERLIYAMARMADYRSPETGYHLERVRQYTRLLATDLSQNDYPELTPMHINHILALSPLHDIGKVAIPDDILHKPGKLTREEFETMKAHVSIGGALLDEVYEETGSELIRVARDIVLYHHERWDGKGYPEGRAGVQIPLPARIVALADVYDALTSDRCYKQAYERETSKQIIVDERGRHFDPAVVNAFLRNEEAFWDVRMKCKDGSDRTRTARPEDHSGEIAAMLAMWFGGPAPWPGA